MSGRSEIVSRMRFLLLAFLSLNLALAKGLVCFEPGECQSASNDLTVTETPEDCLLFCQEGSNCNWFTWYSNNACFTFQDCPTPLSQDCNGEDSCVSGQRECEVNPVATQCDLQVLCKSVPLDVVAVDTVEICVNSVCRSDPDCEWFTFDAAGICLTFATCDDKSPCDQCNTGESTCDVGPACDLQGRCMGLLVGQALTDSADSCLRELCQPNPECQWYTYDSLEGICVTFSSCDTFDSECTTCISGESDCQAELCHVPGRCLAVYFDVTLTNSEDECLAECKVINDCLFYTFDSSTKACFLFDECDDVGQCDTCTSGSVNCSP